RSGDRDTIGARMLEAHDLLGGLGVSSPTLDSLVAAATAAGARGAKLTGGGLGGCVLALADDDESADELADALRAAGAPRTWTTEVRPTCEPRRLGPTRTSLWSSTGARPMRI